MRSQERFVRDHKANPRNAILFTAIVTPFDTENRIDFIEFGRLLKEQELAGNGVVILGSTGEGLALTEEEKQEVVRFSSSLGLQIPVLTGVSGFQLPQTLRFLRFCEEQPGIDGYLMPVPLYAKPGLEGQAEWFTALFNAVSRPTMIYNIPSRTGVKLHPEVLTRLEHHPHAWAVKESSGSTQEFQAFRQAAPALQFYCGDDALLPSFAACGAVGLVSVAGNVWPVATHRYAELCLAGKGNTLPMWKPACDALFMASNPVPTKALLRIQGRIAQAGVRAPLSERDLPADLDLRLVNKSIEAWHASL